MSWLFLGVVYSAAFATVGWMLRDSQGFLSWFRAIALLVPPLVGFIVIVWRRHTWRGCQWLFWATIALGLAMSGIGLTGWAAEEFVLGQGTWLAWPAVFALFGNVAPLFALMAQPHRGPQEPLAATTAVDIAGLAVVTGFLYSFFVTTPSSSLILVSELQQSLVLAALVAAMVAARHSAWRLAYRRLMLGAAVSLATLTLSNIELGEMAYRSAFVYDFTWILPFAFFPWAAAVSPPSELAGETDTEQDQLARPRPWVIFTAVALLPFLDFGLRQIAPEDGLSGFRNLSTAITIISVLPLLVARIAAERAELQQAGTTMRLMSQVIEQTQDLILVLTADGRCRHANDAFCRALESPREKILSRRPRDLMTNEPISSDDIQSVVRSGGAWRGTVSRVRPNGSTFPVSSTMVALRDAQGALTHFVSIERDISEERRLREQLIHSERLSAVGELVAGVAHELNNPLQAVMGHLELLIGIEERANMKDELEEVRANGERAAKIVRNLLTFARRSALHRAVADLNELVRATLSWRRSDLTAGHVLLIEDYDEELPLVIVNREEIQQIVLNLVMNAEHALHAADRPGTLRVSTRADGDAVRVEIADDGPGMPADVASRIFEPFFTTKSAGEGTGLGLSLSLGIAEAHGGSLELIKADQGATFALTLPLAPVTTADVSNEAVAS